MDETVTVWVVVGTMVGPDKDSPGVETELAKFFEEPFAHEHGAKLTAAGLQRGWKDVRIVQREERVADQHPAHQHEHEHIAARKQAAAARAEAQSVADAWKGELGTDKPKRRNALVELKPVDADMVVVDPTDPQPPAAVAVDTTASVAVTGPLKDGDE